MKKYEWRYWFAGMKTPFLIPKGCQVKSESKWYKDAMSPSMWRLPRRWKVAIKTCKWHEQTNGTIQNPHNGDNWHKDGIGYCPTCGKPVEIVKKGAK